MYSTVVLKIVTAQGADVFEVVCGTDTRTYILVL